MLGLLIYGRSDGLWAQDTDEQLRVMALDCRLDLVRVLTGRPFGE